MDQEVGESGEGSQSWGREARRELGASSTRSQDRGGTCGKITLTCPSLLVCVLIENLSLSRMPFKGDAVIGEYSVLVTQQWGCGLSSEHPFPTREGGLHPPLLGDPGCHVSPVLCPRQTSTQRGVLITASLGSPPRGLLLSRRGSGVSPEGPAAVQEGLRDLP